MADRFTVIVDDTGLTYPNCIPVFWTFDEDSRKGAPWRNTDSAHQEANQLNNLSPNEAAARAAADFRTINGLDENLGR